MILGDSPYSSHDPLVRVVEYFLFSCKPYPDVFSILLTRWNVFRIIDTFLYRRLFPVLLPHPCWLIVWTPDVWTSLTFAVRSKAILQITDAYCFCNNWQIRSAEAKHAITVNVLLTEDHCFCWHNQIVLA